MPARNIGTATILRVGPYDAEIFAPLLSPYFSTRDIVSLPNFRAYVRSQGRLGQIPFSIELDPPPARGFKERADELRHLSRFKYGRDREEVEKEIAETYRQYQDLGR